MRLSYSRLACYDDCPAKFHAQYIQQPTVNSFESYMIIGSLIHECCDDYVKHLVLSRQATDYEQFDRIFDSAWDSWQLKNHLAHSFKEEAHEIIQKAKEVISYDFRMLTVESEVSIAIDLSFKKVAWDSEHAFIRGRVDLIEINDQGEIEITDYKTGYRTNQLHESRQLSIYAILASQEYKFKNIRGRILFLRSGKSSNFVIGEEQINRTIQWIESVHKSIQKSEQNNTWPATPGSACRGCAAFKICPARKGSSKITPPDSFESAINLVEKLIMVSREREELISALGPWINQYGQVEVNGSVFGYQMKNILDFDPVKTWELLEKRGMRPLDFMRVDRIALKKIGRRDRKLAEELEKLATDRSFSELKLKNAEEVIE